MRQQEIFVCLGWTWLYGFNMCMLTYTLQFGNIWGAIFNFLLSTNEKTCIESLSHKINTKPLYPKHRASDLFNYGYNCFSPTHIVNSVSIFRFLLFLKTKVDLLRMKCLLERLDWILIFLLPLYSQKKILF